MGSGNTKTVDVDVQMNGAPGASIGADAVATSDLRLWWPAMGVLLAILGLHDWARFGYESAACKIALTALGLAGLVTIVAARIEATFPGRRANLVANALLGATALGQLLHVAVVASPERLYILAAIFVAAGFWMVSAGALTLICTTSFLVAVVLAEANASTAEWLPMLLSLAVAGAAGQQVAIRRKKDRSREFAELEQLRVEAEDGRQIRATEKSGRSLKCAVDSSRDGHWYWDLQTDKCEYSKNWAEMLGFDEKEISNSPDEWMSRVHGHYLPQLKEDLSAHIYGRSDRFQSQFRMQSRDGSHFWALARGLAIRDENGNPTAVCGSLIDVTHLVQTEQSVLDDAFLDRLTGLANRNAFMIRLERAMNEASRDSGLVALIFMDLNRFKVVNDTHGHAVGDQLLSAASSRLKGCLRARSGDMLARLGGDEFVLLMEDISSQQDAVVVANRCLAALKRPFQIGDLGITSGGSIGIAFNNTELQGADDLLRNADTAMYKAKSGRKGEPQVFNQQMYEETLRVYELETDLSRALGRGEFVLVYQPVVAFATGQIVAAEALLRWKRTGGAVVGPSEFIPIAEETGDIEAIGEWVLQQAVRQNVVWQRVGLPPIKVAVNLSPRQLQNSGFAKSVECLLEREGLDAEWMELELTETALMENLEEVATTISSLQKLGVDVSIDDFGTGYSSLGYLRRLSFDSLKMDRAFVADLTTDPQALAVAEGLIQLAHSLKLRVTAEGVETREQLAILDRFGCDQLQGYLASRPLPVEKMGEALRAGGRSLFGNKRAPAMVDSAVPASQLA